MKKVLFIATHYKDRAPGQRFRFEQYFDYLESKGFECTLSNIVTPEVDKFLYTQGSFLKKGVFAMGAIAKRYRDAVKAKDYDIVFLFREALLFGTVFPEKMIGRSRAKMIFDFDDSIWLDTHQNVSDANRKLAFLKKPNKTADIIKASDMVFAGNQYLSDYASQFSTNVKIVPTTIDTHEYQRIAQPYDKVVIGWSGSVTTIQHFNFAIPFLEKIKQKYGDKVEIRVMGDPNYRHESLDIKGIGWSKAEEIPYLSTYDIGIMPLPDDEWAKGKCGLKGLQYMALEIPTIMSPVGVNSDIITDGENGYLASTVEEWEEKLKDLIDNPERRVKLGKAGRQTVVDHYSVTSQRDRYVQYFNKVLLEED